MADNTTFTIKGLDSLNARLKGMTGAEIQKTLKQTTDKAVKYVHSQVPPYPAPPPASCYSRTGMLGRSINTQVKEVGSEIQGVIGSPIEYSPWVISSEAVAEVGAGPQAWMHKGRWWTLQEVVNKALGEVKRIYSEMLRDMLK